MDRINGAGTIDIGAGRRGFVDEDLAVGQEGTEVTASWLTMVQEEILKVIEATGGEASESDWSQLAKAILGGKLNYALAGGTANAITAALPVAPSLLVEGLRVSIKLTATNSGEVSLNLNGLGAVPVKRPAGLGLKANEFPAGAIANLVYDGAVWQVGSVLSSGLSAPPTIVDFTAPGTTSWVCPSGVFFVEVEVWGGGGGGAGASAVPSQYAGEGGAGGGYSRGVFAVTPGTSYPVTVGAGGTAGPANGSAGAGGTSSFGSFLSATGGTQGRIASPNGGSPATIGREGGVGTGGSVNLKGGWGNVVSLVGSAVYPGAGGAAPLGGQGAISSATTPSIAGSPGGGGGGAAGASNSGTAGAPGRVTIKF